MKTCSRCKSEKPDTDFRGENKTCISCGDRFKCPHNSSLVVETKFLVIVTKNITTSSDNLRLSSYKRLKNYLQHFINAKPNPPPAYHLMGHIIKDEIRWRD